MTTIADTSGYLVDGCLQTDQGLIKLPPHLIELVLLLCNTEDSDSPHVRASRKLIYQAGLTLKTAVPYAVPPETVFRDDPPPAPPVPAKPTKTSEIRQWALNNGFPSLKGQGRIPKAVMEAYEEAHADV